MHHFTHHITMLDAHNPLVGRLRITAPAHGMIFRHDVLFIERDIDRIGLPKMMEAGEDALTKLIDDYPGAR